MLFDLNPEFACSGICLRSEPTDQCPSHDGRLEIETRYLKQIGSPTNFEKEPVRFLQNGPFC